LRTLSLNPSSRIADFLGSGYSTKGVALASLNNLLPIYSSPSLLLLAELKNFFPNPTS
jgi:hypothetical protein